MKLTQILRGELCTRAGSAHIPYTVFPLSLQPPPKSLTSPNIHGSVRFNVGHFLHTTFPVPMPLPKSSYTWECHPQTLLPKSYCPPTSELILPPLSFPDFPGPLLGGDESLPTLCIPRATFTPWHTVCFMYSCVQKETMSSGGVDSDPLVSDPFTHLQLRTGTPDASYTQGWGQ